MNPGRELDALVAEEVLGWRVDFGDSGPVVPDRRTFKMAIDPGGLGEPQEVAARLPEFSTDIADAWVVVEEMQERGFENPVIFHEAGEWVVNFLNGKHYTREDTAPQAICIAALKAVGYDFSEDTE